MTHWCRFFIGAVMLLTVAACDNLSPEDSVNGMFCPDRNLAGNLYWGDLHVHSSYSLDAYAFGTKTNPADAYAFAKGERSLPMPDGTMVKQSRPLDFAAVTEHAETFDVMHICTQSHHGENIEYCRKILDNAGTEAAQSLTVFRDVLLPILTKDPPQRAALCTQDGMDCEGAMRAHWQDIRQFSQDANEPCKFTAFMGYEWSSTPNAAHWHRNIIFRSAAVTARPVDYVRYPTPDLMWRALEEQCRIEEGCEALAIPHNTNYSEGGGFDVEKSDEVELLRRAKYERLIEIVQSKGTSECLLENWDEFGTDCGFEISLLRQSKALLSKKPSLYKQFNRSFARNILSRGLQSYAASGEAKRNPLQMGFIGSTDSHTAMPGLTDEKAWKGDAWGGGGNFTARWLTRMDFNPGGLVAVWASQNTRADIFDALKNRHAYATSGTRIKLRFGKDPKNLCPNQTFSAATPMGGSFHKSNGAPQFTLFAQKDVAPLSRIQIIKGALTGGEISEAVYTVYNADMGRGKDKICTTWRDPDFDAASPAYYYMRVEEVATPRWSKYACAEIDCTIPNADRMIKERAWSSPIWYLP